jgi:uncharacterized phage protein (predicted DNA packaging)
MRNLLVKVKANLIIQHDEDDELLLGYITAAVNYAESYQKIKYGRRKFPAATEQAIVMLTGHFYESRDGATAGFFSDFVSAVNNVWLTVHRLLAMDKVWEV